jgi:hypothetical protein
MRYSQEKIRAAAMRTALPVHLDKNATRCESNHNHSPERSPESPMKKEKLQLDWAGPFIELCKAGITGEQKAQIEARCPGIAIHHQTQWYENTKMLQELFSAANWWAVDDLDHTMGLVFKDRAALKTAMADMRFEIQGRPTAVDPDAFQLRFFAQEATVSAAPGEEIICHGARCEAQLKLEAEFKPPFDPSLLTLAFIDDPETGLILIDLDYDGHNEAEYTFGPTSYLPVKWM